MPCTFCTKAYIEIPCNRNKNYDGKPILKEVWNNYYQEKEIKKIVDTHRILREYCPCELCLVKTMCRKLCKEYVYRVIEPIWGPT